MKDLLILQIKNNGISPDVFETLSASEKDSLELINGKYFLQSEYRKKLRVVITGGVFDILHAGHLFTLQEAKKYGDILVVAIARDEMILRKKRKPVHSQEYRAFMVESLKPVDIALLGKEDPKELFEQVKPNVIVYGYDQKPFLAPEGVKVVQLSESFGGFKTNKIIKDLGL
ncbi:MAG TPA: adenylyltransferase/cytidyltransferase family protein [Candidatus Bilamarchaeaceae archaeon]|nr:adenylyltransferase/cytidyltransferase family protein [Candidatus Bilamarchaeaceae archaeon]